MRLRVQITESLFIRPRWTLITIFFALATIARSTLNSPYFDWQYTTMKSIPILYWFASNIHGKFNRLDRIAHVDQSGPALKLLKYFIGCCDSK